MDGFRAMAAACGSLVQRPVLPPVSCNATVTVVGLRVYSQRKLTAWRGFACEQHADQLVAPRRLLPRDEEVLRRRRERETALLAGRAWDGPEEGPLARGRDAERLVARAQAWAARYPLRTGPQQGVRVAGADVGSDWVRGPD